MKLLFDTQVWLSSLAQPEPLNDEARVLLSYQERSHPTKEQAQTTAGELPLQAPQKIFVTILTSTEVILSNTSIKLIVIPVCIARWVQETGASRQEPGDNNSIETIALRRFVTIIDRLFFTSPSASVEG